MPGGHSHSYINLRPQREWREPHHWTWGPAWPLPHCATWDPLVSLSEPRLPHLPKSHENIQSVNRELRYGGSLAQDSAQESGPAVTVSALMLLSRGLGPEEHCTQVPSPELAALWARRRRADCWSLGPSSGQRGTLQMPSHLPEVPAPLASWKRGPQRLTPLPPPLCSAWLSRYSAGTEGHASHGPVIEV